MKTLKKTLLVSSLCFVVLGAYSQDVTLEKKIVPGISSDKLFEFSPTISADGKRIIFESSVNEDKGWELFESQLENGVWTKPVPLQSINEKCQFIAGPSLSYDGNRLYYTAYIEGVTKTEDIYYSERTGESTWSEPKSIGAPINTDDNYEGFPSISSDGKSLYFIRLNQDNDYDRKSKEACFIIYVSKKMADGKWSEPVPLPSPINTGCERDPKIMADNHTLIFSSIREGGLGKYDMFQIRLQHDGTWSTPVTLDFINSADNDQSPCISASGDVMFFYSKKDIYSVPIPEKFKQMVNTVVTGRVLEYRKNEHVSAKIKVTNIKSGESFSISNNETDGEYSVVLSTGSKYSVIFDNENFFPDTLIFDLENQKTYQLLQKDIILRSSFEAKVDVIDKDLKFKISAFVTLQQDGKDIFKDTIQASKLPTQFKLEAPLNYTLLVSKEKYPDVKVDWVFKERRVNENRNMVVAIEHEKVPFVANVVSSSSKQKVKIKVYANNKNVEETIIAEAGEKIFLRKGEKYQVITGSEEGYFFSSKEVTAGDVETAEMQVIPIEVNGKVALNNITFETNSADLKDGSQFELDRVVELMKVNPKLSIEISAHTDDVGDPNSNLKLSDKRAKTAWEYLIKKGIEKHRLTPKGYGETQPMLPNDTDENRAQNRRVELRALKVS